MRPHALRDTELADNIELRGIGIHQSYSPPTLVIAIQHAISGDDRAFTFAARPWFPIITQVLPKATLSTSHSQNKRHPAPVLSNHTGIAPSYSQKQDKPWPVSYTHLTLPTT